MLDYLRLYLRFKRIKKETMALLKAHISITLQGSGGCKILALLVCDCRRLSDNRVNRPMIEGLGQQLSAALSWQL